MLRLMDLDGPRGGCATLCGRKLRHDFTPVLPLTEDERAANLAWWHDHGWTDEDLAKITTPDVPYCGSE